MARNAGGAGTQVVRLAEVVHDEVFIETVGDHLGVGDPLEAAVQHFLDALRDDRRGAVAFERRKLVRGQIAVVVGGLGAGQQVVDVVIPGGGKTGVPVAHAEEQGLGVVAHHAQGDDSVTGALAAVTGHHKGLAGRDGRTDIGQQAAQRAVVGAGDVTGGVDRGAADVDDRVGVGVHRQLGGQRVGADAAHREAAVVIDQLGGVDHCLELGGGRSAGHFQRIGVGRAVPDMGAEIIMEQGVGAELQALGLIAHDVQIRGDLAGVLTRPAIDHDGLVGGQVVQHRVAVQAGVGGELEGSGDVARDAGGAVAQIVILAEVVHDEEVIEAVGDHL